MDEFSLRKATIDDAKLLLAWRNDIVARQNYFSSEVVLYTTHIKWFSQALMNPNMVILIFEKKNNPIGQVRFDVNVGIAEISYYIATEFRGQGMATKMLRLAETFMLENHNNIKFKAEVKKGNIASQRVFERLGYDVELLGDIFVYMK